MNTLEAIKFYRIEVNPEHYEDDEGKLIEYWSCFNNRDGGCWQEGKTLEEVVAKIVAAAKE